MVKGESRIRKYEIIGKMKTCNFEDCTAPESDLIPCSFIGGQQEKI